MKILVGLMAVVLFLAVTTGVGYAWSTGGHHHHCDDEDECESSAAIAWENPSGAAGNAPYVLCTLGLSTHVLTATAGNLAPGVLCTFHATLVNIGTSSVTLTEAVSISPSANCPYFHYNDNIPSDPAPQLAPGHSYSWQATFGLGSGATNACQGASAVLSVTITGTAVSSCDDDLIPGHAIPLGTVLPDWECDD